MAKSFIQNAVGFTNANFYPGSPIQGNLVAASTSNLIYEPSFTSFITPSSPGITYNDPIWGTRKFHRTPLGACYAVWSDPRVASGSLGTDLNSKWVASSSPGVVGTAQVTLLAGYSTVYIPVSNGDINANSQFFVEFSDGISAYIYAGQMNLQDIGGTQSISINVADGTSLDQNDPNVVTQTYYPAMVYPFVCWTSQQKTLTLRVNRTIGSGNAFIGPPVVLKGVCSWFITQ